MKRLTRLSAVVCLRRVVAVLIGLSLLLPMPAVVASSNNPAQTSALRISPAINQVRLRSNQTTVLLDVTVTNMTGAQLAVNLSARDFGALNQSGTISFFGNDYRPATNPHSLQQAVIFAKNPVSLAAGSSQQVTVTITHANSLAPGGHYGAVLFTPEAGQAVGAQATHITLQASVATLIFLTTAAGGTQSVSMRPLQLSPVRLSLPTMNYLVFANAGNTQTALRGQLSLYGPGSKLISTAVLNHTSGLILPGSSRLFVSNFEEHASPWALPGVYRLQVRYRADASKQFITVTRRFVYLNPQLLFVGVAIIGLGLWGVKRYGHHLIRRDRRHHLPPLPSAPVSPVKKPHPIRKVLR